MIGKEKTVTEKGSIIDRYGFSIDWNWLFSRCHLIFASIFFIGFVVFLFWLL